MKKIYSLALALCAIAAVSCNKETVPTPEPKLVSMTFEASYEDDATTRAILDGLNLKWSEGDQVAIFDDKAPTTPHLFNVTNIDGIKASLEGEVTEGAEHFLAVYPYSAAVAAPTTYTESSNTWYSNLIIPAEQTAVAGSVDPKAITAVGGCNPDNLKFKFRYTGALLKFQVSDDDVTSVTFSATNTNIAGIIQYNQISAQANGPSGVGNGQEAYGERSKTVTLKAEDTFTKGVDYYVYVRYTGSNSYQGFTASLVNSKGGTAEKASSSNFSVARKTIYNLGDFSGLTWDTPSVSLYQKYMAGEDLVIAGTTYNKSTHGDGVLLTPRNLGGDQLNGAGNIVFLAPGTYTTGGEAKFTHDIVVSADDPDDKPVITTAEKSWNLSGAGFTGSNLKFDLAGMTGNQFFSNKTATKDIPHFILEDCIIRNCPRYLYATNSGAYAYAINEILVNRCVIETSNTNSPALFNVNNGMTNPTGFKKFTVTNSELYHASGNVVGWLLFNYLPDPTSSSFTTFTKEQLDAMTWPMEITLNNNILYNIASNSSNVRNYAAAKLTVKGNLIVCPDYTPANAMKIYTQRIKTADLITLVPDYADNYVYAAAGSENNWITADDAFSTNLGQTKKIPLLSENPLSKADLTKGEFEVKAAYSAYGPQK